MSRSLFGWSLPPGVTSRMIDNAYGEEAPCEVCGQPVDDCVCPECPVCREYGNPKCYDGATRCSRCGMPCLDPTKCIIGHCDVSMLPSHGLVRSRHGLSTHPRAR